MPSCGTPPWASLPGWHCSPTWPNLLAKQLPQNDDQQAFSPASLGTSSLLTNLVREAVDSSYTVLWIPASCFLPFQWKHESVFWYRGDVHVLVQNLYSEVNKQEGQEDCVCTNCHILLCLMLTRPLRKMVVYLHFRDGKTKNLKSLGDLSGLLLFSH